MFWILPTTFPTTHFTSYKMYTYLLGSISPNPLIWLIFQQLSSIIISIESELKSSASKWSKNIPEFSDFQKLVSNKRLYTITQLLKTPMSDLKLLSCRELCNLFGCHKSKIYRLMNNNQFPRPLRFGSSVRWKSIDIRNYQNSLEVTVS